MSSRKTKIFPLRDLWTRPQTRGASRWSELRCNVVFCSQPSSVVSVISLLARMSASLSSFSAWWLLRRRLPGRREPRSSRPRGSRRPARRWRWPARSSQRAPGPSSSDISRWGKHLSLHLITDSITPMLSQTLSGISAEKNSTVIFPIPIDIIKKYLSAENWSISILNLAKALLKYFLLHFFPIVTGWHS